MESRRNRLHPIESDIFLTSTDVVGYRVATGLIKEVGSKVRVGIASDQADSQISQDLKARGVSLVPFSWEDERTYSKAVQGAKIVFCVVPHHEGWAKHFPAFFDTCRKNGVKHFVKLSFYNALVSTRPFVVSINKFVRRYSYVKGFHVPLRVDNPLCQVPLIKMHGDCDQKIIKSHAMDYTILFATHLMSDPAVYQRRNIMSDQPHFYSASAGKGVNYVSPNDIAAVAVRVLANPKDHHRVGYTLTGPTPITDDQVAELLSRDLNKTVEYVDLAPEDYRRMCCTSTSPTSMWLADDLVDLEALKATGIEVKFLSKDFEKLCGRPAETFAEYLDAKIEMTPTELLI
jgi:uncharacterized protein YbjT (DUF2867 family)